MNHMKIVDVICAPGKTGFFFDDQKAIKGGAKSDGAFYAVSYTHLDVYKRQDVTSALKKPVQVRHGTPDARLLTEISIAGGFTSYEGGGISYNIPYSKDHSLEKRCV